MLQFGAAERLRLVFLTAADLRFAGRLVRSTETPNVQWAALQQAYCNRLGDVTVAAAEADGAAASLAGGDTLNLSFATPPLAAGQVREWFLTVGATLLSSHKVQSARLHPGVQAAPSRLAMAQNQPNPFSRTTSIRFELPSAGPVTLAVFDLLGRRVRVLLDEVLPAGSHIVDWHRTGASGNPVSPGIYVCRIEAEGSRAEKKIVVLP